MWVVLFLLVSSREVSKFGFVSSSALAMASGKQSFSTNSQVKQGRHARTKTKSIIILHQGDRTVPINSTTKTLLSRMDYLIMVDEPKGIPNEPVCVFTYKIGLNRVARTLLFKMPW